MSEDGSSEELRHTSQISSQLGERGDLYNIYMTMMMMMMMIIITVTVNLDGPKQTNDKKPW